MARKLTGIKNFTKYQKTVAGNGHRIREGVRKYIMQRKSGERKSQVPDGVDILSLFFANPKEFTDDLIIDELVDFIAAGVLTTQNAI